ncbi:MAG: polysaccharide deacetylase family protein [Kiritimatiellia bacterium]
MKHPRMGSMIASFTAACDSASRWRPRLMIVYYHTLPESRLDAFRAQLDALVALAKPIAALAGDERQPAWPCVAVTIDDGFVSTIQRALPNLMARNIPVTLFVPAGLLGCKPGWPPGGEFDAQDEMIISGDELRVLAREPLVTIASHGMNHADFARLEEREARYQLAASKALLEHVTERPVNGFSFPYGSARASHVSWAHDAGYTHVFGTNPSPAGNGHHGLIGRVRVDPWDPLPEFERKLRGAYRWLGYASGIKQRIQQALEPVHA